MAAPRLIYLLTPDDYSRFWVYVTPLGLQDCWEWQDRRMPSGYGRLKLDDTSHALAHRVSLIISGRLPSLEKPLALHSCDNPPCCNPNHLSWGTHKENMRQARVRGLMVTYEKDFCIRGHPMSGNNLRLKPFTASNGVRYYNRLCRECENMMQQARRAAKRLK